MSDILFSYMIHVDGHLLARELRNTAHVPTKQAFLDALLGDMDDTAYAMVCKFVAENPLEPK